jgi:hypothetical protein
MPTAKFRASTILGELIFLRGKVLQAMYKPCYLDAHQYFEVGG